MSLCDIINYVSSSAKPTSVWHFSWTVLLIADRHKFFALWHTVHYPGYSHHPTHGSYKGGHKMLVTYATVLYIMDNCQGTDAVIVRRSKERCCEDSSARKKVSS